MSVRGYLARVHGQNDSGAGLATKLCGHVLGMVKNAEWKEEETNQGELADTYSQHLVQRSLRCGVCPESIFEITEIERRSRVAGHENNCANWKTCG